MNQTFRRGRAARISTGNEVNRRVAAASSAGDGPAKTINAIAALVVFVALFAWAYWPTFAQLAERWYRVPDYSHGFLVIPCALLFLWARRSTRPPLSPDARWLGLIVVLGALAFRVAGARMFLPAFDAWSIMPWLAGVSLWVGGKRFFIWCLPAILFLFFMVPLPYRAEHALNVPLRNAAASSGTFLLQCLGQPAVQEGTLIVLEDEEFEVAKECSGLRMLMGVCALAFAYVVLSRGPYWQKVLILLSALPVAVAANVLRVTATALFCHFVDSDGIRDIIHDSAGWVTFAIAAGLFSLVLWCLGRMFIEVEVEEGSRVLHGFGK